jgi:predicted metal-dependent phosphoesterase TrpH
MITTHCDLHTHSWFSDGTDSPSELLNKAAALGFSAIALTDHNTVAGLPEFLEAAEGTGILAVPGVEISTGYNGKELHILGLFLKPDRFAEITEFLSVINQRKEASNRQLMDNLNRAGYLLCYDEIVARHQGNINRAVIAAELLEKGYISEIKEAFKGLLSAKNGYYHPPERIPAPEAIGFPRSVGAVPVLAHPFLNMQAEELTGFIQKAQPCGLAAMETRYATYSPEITSLASGIARDHNLLESGGSDYHGRNKPEIQLGTGRGNLAVPFSFACDLRSLSEAVAGDTI